TVVTAIDREAKQVELEGGERIGYGTLLLATGSEPRRLEGPEDERVIHFRSFADYRTLPHLATDGTRAVVASGGYIVAEIAAALSQNGAHATLVFPDDVLRASQSPPSITQGYQKLLTDHGVELLPGLRAALVTVQAEAVVGV